MAQQWLPEFFEGVVVDPERLRAHRKVETIETDTCYQAKWPEGISGHPKARFSTQWWGNWTPQNHPPPSSDEASGGSLAWTNWPLYTVGLVTRGYSDSDIEKIIGANFMRMLDANPPTDEVAL